MDSVRTDQQSRPGLRVLGLFSGIGGFELGLDNTGHTAIELCERDPVARAVLEDHFGDIPCQKDVRDYSSVPDAVDLVTAGFPCQDLSQAGRTLGLQGDHSSLVSEVFRILRSNDVPWLLLENVPFMLRLGSGSTFETIIRTIEELEYSWAYRVVDSRAFGLPQRRKRVFLLASKTADPREVLLVDSEVPLPERFAPEGEACGFYWTEGTRGLGWAVNAIPTLKSGSTIGIPSPPAVWLPDGPVIKPGIRDAERMQGFRPDWTKAAENVGRSGLRWRLVGNAVTVNAAEWIGWRLRNPGEFHQGCDVPLPAGSKWPDAAYNVGEGRFSCSVSQFPLAKPVPRLEQFLNTDEAADLSLRAVSGFLSRFEASSLKRPPGFLEALREHRSVMADRV